MSDDQSNRELCAELRELLTHGVYFVDDDGVIAEGFTHAVALKHSKPWRAELWRAFNEIEDRLCPVQAFAKAKRKM
jgi:hypothetical protein